MIGTITEVKQLLDIPVADTSRDGALTLMLSVASSRVLQRLRFTETDVSGHQDVFREAIVGRELTLSLRPVVSVTLAEAKGFGETSWTKVQSELIDAANGRVVMLGSDLGWWPPTKYVKPPWQKWSDQRWPMVRFTYNATGIGTADAAPQDLRAAVCTLAGYWLDRVLAGAKTTSELIRLIHAEYSDAPVPGWVESMLAAYRDPQVARWV